MIIQLDSVADGALAPARENLAAMVRSWGEELSGRQAEAAPAGAPIVKGVDPVAVGALLHSIPSTVLAVQDLADRIRKRRRARELISQAQELHAQRVTARIVTSTRSVELRGLTPDQLLELLDGENSGD